MPLAISILTGSSTSIYRQVVEQICLAVYDGKIANDEPLPSVRGLAEQLVINPNTVAKAYAELAREGVIESRPGRGMFVCKRRQIYSKAERTRRMDQAVSTFVTQAVMLGYTPDQIVEEVRERTQSIVPTQTSPRGGAK